MNTRLKPYDVRSGDQRNRKKKKTTMHVLISSITSPNLEVFK